MPRRWYGKCSIGADGRSADVNKKKADKTHKNTPHSRSIFVQDFLLHALRSMSYALLPVRIDESCRLLEEKVELCRG